MQEDALRAMLADDPNNEQAFAALVALVHKNCAGEGEDANDPLKAAEDAATFAEKRKVAVWALAEEYSGHPRAWYPLIELARLSLPDSVEESVRRLNAAVARDASGTALATAIDLLLERELYHEAYNLGVGNWRPKEHHAAAGVRVVRAALKCERLVDAENSLQELLANATNDDIAAVDPQLIADVKGVSHQ